MYQSIQLATKSLTRGVLFQRSPLRWGLGFMATALVCFALAQSRVYAVTPAPDGGYPGGNTAEGTQALQSLTSGAYNTALGHQALFHDASGGLNSATGFRALFSNTTGNYNTATGGNSLFSNTTGGNNTAHGVSALYHNTTGASNTASGYQALMKNTTGNQNTATGLQALSSNTNGIVNTATGSQALASNTNGTSNTGTGVDALRDTTSGGGNTAHGYQALLHNDTGDYNTADGLFALGGVTTGDNNTAVGRSAGTSVTTAHHVICIGANVSGANVSNSCYIGQIFGVTSSGGAAVFVNSSGKLGTTTSSRRFKEEINPMGKASEVILTLKPVTFHYKKDIDPQGAPQFGLVAEDVEKVDAALVVRDADGKVNTVRYEAVNAMLLNEFLKDHRKVEDLKATVAKQQKEMETVIAHLKEQEAKIRKVSAQIQLSKPAPRTAVNSD